MYNKQAIENFPLQVYVSALIFSPKKSLIRSLFQYEDLQRVKIRPTMADNWSPCWLTLEGHSEWVRSVVMSGDSRCVVTASVDSTARTWEASSGRCLQRLEISGVLDDISFDANSEVLRTDIGPLHFDVLTGSKPAAVTAAADTTHDQTLGLSGDGRWITVASKNLVWLPSEYRPSCSVVSGKVMGVGVGSGRMWTCSVNI